MVFSTDKFGKNDIARNESLFTVANGNIGLRGDTEEKEGTFHKGTYINGFFESESILYGEVAYGYAKNHETIVNLPDPKRIEMLVDGKSFGPAGIHNQLLQLDEEKGLLQRQADWQDGENKIHLESQRLASFLHPSCAAIKYEITNTSSKSQKITLISCLDTESHNIMGEEDPRVGAKFRHKPLVLDGYQINGGQISCHAHTQYSGLKLQASIINELKNDDEEVEFKTEKSSAIKEDIPYTIATFDLEAGKKACLYKYISFSWGKEISQNAGALCKAFAESGFENACREQKKFLDDFWKIAHIEIEGDQESQEALHFNLYHLLQSAGRSGKVSIAAKGLTSEGYEGHFFWDTESYVCPVFTYTAPEIAKKLLEYRASILDKAKARAQELNLKGALYPWRTIDGEETSAYFPAGTAQYHIDADIIFALNRYLNAHQGDLGFDQKAVEEMCLETARMWMSLGSFIPHKDNKFCINDVTGPDEYTAIVNNNAFTNLMARENLEISLERVGTDPSSLSEKDQWKKAAENMYIPFDKESAIYPQDDSFMDKPDWDFENTPSSNYPLLMHYHPLEIYRHRVLKQPDLVLAQFLLSGRFTKAEKIRNFNFYEKYTTGDSSLSNCIMSIMAAESANTQKAFDYFNKTARMDIDDVNGNSRDGIHTACMAGSWMSVVYGFAGFRDYKGIYSFDPKLPEKWSKLNFNLAIQGYILSISISQNKVLYKLSDEEGVNKTTNKRGLSLIHRNESFTLEAGQSREFDLSPKLEAVLFDLDGIITNTANLHYKAWRSLAQENKLHFDEEINKKLMGLSREDSAREILKANGQTWSQEKLADFCKKKNDLYVSLLATLSEKDILPGIKDLLQELNQKGIICVLASSSKNAPAILKQLGITKLFAAVVDASKVQKAKPHADIFLEAAQLSGKWYTNCIGIEDAQSGVDAIKAGGIKALGVSPDGSLKEADAQVESTSQISYSKLLEVMSK
ncbi:MAG: beta-phosphoglucomutase [Treponema sp.]|nr:beta-phosphoglucomutase [Treponema sp.]